MSEQEVRTEDSKELSALSLGGEHTRRAFLKKAGIGSAAVAAAWIVPQVTSVGARRAYAAVTGPCVTTVVDFEGLAAGTVVTNQIPGITVSAVGGSNKAMIFDSSTPTGQDDDLGTPNGVAVAGGPGVGTGGESGAGINNIAMGKVLIISEDGDSSDPDDNAGGGTIKFVFDNKVSVSTVTLLDIDNETAQIKTFENPDCTGLLTTSHATIPAGLGDNSVEQITVGALGGNVRSMTVQFSSSGAVAEFVCPCP